MTAVKVRCAQGPMVVSSQSLLEHQMKTKHALAAATVLLSLITAGCSSPYAAGPNAGPYGPGTAGCGYGWGAGYGMRPGMMGYGHGPGMMGPGYGPGAGPGPGMMGPGYGAGPGMGPGMMGGVGPGLAALPTLTADQRTRLSAIQQQLAQQQWPLMQQMHQLMWAQGGGSADEQQERGSYDAVAKLHRQMFENSLQARRQMEEVLTPEQREQLRRGWGGRGAARPGAPG